MPYNRIATPSGQGAEPCDLAVLHIALELVTGPWSVMRDLALAQSASGLYRGVGMGVVASQRWPASYAAELETLGLPNYRAHTPFGFGTVQFAWQMLQRPPIGQWAADLMAKTSARGIVVHFHNAWVAGALLPLSGAQLPEVKTVSTFHGVNARLEGKPLRRWIHQYMAGRLLRYGARLTSVDAANLALADELFHLSPEKFTVIPNGVARAQELHAAAWTAEGTMIVGYIGSLTERKGWRIAADAVLRLRARGRNIMLLIAGAGPDEGAVRQLAIQHPGVIEFAGYCSSPRREVMPRMHVLSMMSAHEGLPMVLVEAMSVGLPTVATRAGGIPEAIQDGVGGRLVDRSVESLERAVDDLYHNPGMVRQMGAASRAQFDERYEIGHIVQSYHKLYTEGPPHSYGETSADITEKK